MGWIRQHTDRTESWCQDQSLKKKNAPVTWSFVPGKLVSKMCRAFSKPDRGGAVEGVVLTELRILVDSAG